MRKISAEDWRTVFALLDAALDLPPSARGAWLDGLNDQPAPVTDKLRDLLARQDRQETRDFLHQPPRFTLTPGSEAIEISDTATAGAQVGPYRLISPLGRGGMSSVWVAERTDGLPRRRVALKLPHLGWALPDFAERMARERDILASLEHPHIARLYDAGILADGRPYLALELVDGKPIDTYCDEHKADVTTRVAIALQTANAVSYAHSRMVIHRDLKPSNILVDPAGQVHLLDFGIGKLLEQDLAPGSQPTLFGSRAYTPDYASPEQIRGEPVTASTDIYSFGIVLYQLLCGSLPFSDSQRADPRPPSAAARDRAIAQAVRGDLDTIVLKTLKYAGSERYGSMKALADDLDRFLRGAPVLARRDSAWYRLRKFAARNRFALRTAAAAVAVTAAVSLGLSVERARKQRAATAEAVATFADNLSQIAVPRKPPTKDVEAYHEYLQARSIMIRPTEENLREVIRLTQSAIARDPNFAQAYAVLAGANLMHLDNGYSRPEALALAEPAVRSALRLNPSLAGAHASLGVIAAHRSDWLAAEAHFKKAFELDDGSGRIHARYAEAVLNSTGRLREALRVFQVELRNTPTHCRGAMQVAIAFGTQPDRGSEALHYIDVAMSNGWPAESKDVERLNSEIARRKGEYTAAMENEAAALPAASRKAGGVDVVRLLHASLANPARQRDAIAALDALNGRGAEADMESFSMLMFSMTWYTMLGDVDRAFEVSKRWLAESKRTGLSGIPFNLGFWQPEMRPFRADARFGELARHMGLMPYWQKFGAPDDCRLENGTLSCH